MYVMITFPEGAVISRQEKLHKSKQLLLSDGSDISICILLGDCNSTILVNIYQNPVFPQGHGGAADLDVVKGLIEDTVFSTQPAMVLSLRACASSPSVRSVYCTLPPL